jgi:hypothetical protein
MDEKLHIKSREPLGSLTRFFSVFRHAGINQGVFTPLLQLGHDASAEPARRLQSGSG